MIRIDKADWIPKLFAQVKVLGDVLIEPNENLAQLSREQLNKIRNTQALPGETVRVLGHYQQFSLVSKIDDAKGWMLNDWLQEDPALSEFLRPIGGVKTSGEFLNEFDGVPYLWGGLSRLGIDCSGLTQLYFLEVHDKIIPRNSKDQRKHAPERLFETVKDNDLIYGSGRIGGSHHVGIYLGGKIWHAYSDEGVICHSPERFSQLFEIEAVNTLL
jgi:cell wall-associated NlpC family hydrolase